MPSSPQTDALLEQAVRDRVFPGCVYAACIHGQVRAHQAIGRFRYEPDATPVEPDTRYDAASLTKVMAATPAAMLLYERGRLQLDQPVAELLPGFVTTQPDDSRRPLVTVRMLLDHSSGLPGYARLFETATGREGILDLAMRQPLTADPGTRAEYSDLGFILLSAILEQLAGEPLDRFCQREVFTPLGMEATSYCPPPERRATIPPTEIDRDIRHRVIQGEVHDENAWAMGGVSGHAGLFTSALDCLAFAETMMTSNPDASRTRLFLAQTIDTFAKRQCHPHDSSRALGWDTPSAPSSSGSRFSLRSIGHLGFTGTSLWIDRDAGVSIVLLSNRTWPDRANQAIRALRPLFHDTLRAELCI